MSTDSQELKVMKTPPMVDTVDIEIPDFKETLIGLVNFVEKIVPIQQPSQSDLSNFRTHCQRMLTDVYANAFRLGESYGQKAGYDVGYANGCEDTKRSLGLLDADSEENPKPEPDHQ